LINIYRILIIFIFLFGFSSGLSFAGDYPETYKEQLNKVILFYEILNKKEPKVSDFFRLFGEDNEAELQLILRQDFPSLNLQDRYWDLKPDVADHIERIFTHADTYTSRFLECIKSEEPKLFADKIKRQIEFPPEIDGDFRRFIVRATNAKAAKVIFEFSQNEPYIESITLPSGRSIYTLIETCKKRKLKSKNGE
jgi:hypothetical protein